MSLDGQTSRRPIKPEEETPYLRLDDGDLVAGQLSGENLPNIPVPCFFNAFFLFLGENIGDRFEFCLFILFFFCIITFVL